MQGLQRRDWRLVVIGGCGWYWWRIRIGWSILDVLGFALTVTGNAHPMIFYSTGDSWEAVKALQTIADHIKRTGLGDGLERAQYDTIVEIEKTLSSMLEYQTSTGNSK